MNRDEIIARIREIKAERAASLGRITRIRELADALGASPTPAGLMVFLRELRAVISEAVN